MMMNIEKIIMVSIRFASVVALILAMMGSYDDDIHTASRRDSSRMR